MLTPHDYSDAALADEKTRELMALIEFEHGGEEYDLKYPEGIPTSVYIADQKDDTFDSGLVMFPAGHARNTTADLHGILRTKFELLGGLAASSEAERSATIDRLESIGSADAAGMQSIYDFKIAP
jgi:2-methylcitrate dehydratase